MKKLMKLMVVGAIAVVPFVAGGSASAQQAKCDVGFTGPNSNNMCESRMTYKCNVENQTDIKVVNDVGDIVATGTATVSGNNNGGNAKSGTATNENGTNFVVSVTNAGVCTAVVTVPPTVTPEQPVTPVVQTNGGGGGGAVAVLPATSSDSTLQTTALVASALLFVAGLSVGGVLWYRHTKA